MPKNNTIVIKVYFIYIIFYPLFNILSNGSPIMIITIILKSILVLANNTKLLLIDTIDTIQLVTSQCWA